MIFADNLYTVVQFHEEGADSVRYQVRLLPESMVFKAHFPGEPIMPGACIVQMVAELFETWRGQAAEIQRVSNLKFLNVISPAALTELDVVLSVKEQTPAETQLKADVVAGDVVYTRMSLILGTR